MGDINHRLCAGLSVLVGTVDPQGDPSCCRAIAVRTDDDFQTAVVYLPVATAHDTIQNLASTKRVAVTASHPREHRAIQLKGTTSDVRLARDDEAAFVREWVDALATALDTVGVPKRVTRSVAHWPAFAIQMRVEQVFEQTPGPKAGSRLR